VNKYVIFDRDGTLIDHIHYIKDPNLVKLKTWVAEGLIFLKSQGYSFGIISNQSLINRGIGTQQDVEAVNSRLVELCDEIKVSFDFIYFCPHRPDELCDCRKPQIELGLKAIRKYNISRNGSFYIGDKESDVIFAMNLNLIPILVATQRDKIYLNGTLSFSNLLDAAKYINDYLLK
jgi:D-glycero-D-manno-heptose 1,7-bisphosphate phosphatase